jgi:capsular exopolysaccharide synthesis family protein
MEIIQSTPILRMAINDLEERELLSFDESAPSSEPGWIARIIGLVQEGNEEPPLTADERRAAYVESLKRRIVVEPTGGNAFIKITALARRPHLAAHLANAIADSYLTSERELRQSGSEQAVSWLSGKVREQRNRLIAAEENLRRFTGGHEPEEDGIEELADQEMSQLQEALLDVRLKIVEAEAKDIVARGRQDPATPLQQAVADDLSAEVAEAMRAKLREELVEIAVTLSQLRQRYGERHPDVIATADKEKQLREDLERLPPKQSDVGTSTESRSDDYDDTLDLAVLRAQEQAHRESLDKMKSVSLNDKQVGVQSNILTREVEIERSLYNEMLGRLNEITISSGVETGPAEMFEQAKPSDAPVSPDHSRNLLLGLVGGFLLGLGGAAVRDHLDQSIRGPLHANDLMKAPVLGMIPHFGRASAGQPGEASSLFLGKERSFSASAEAYRLLRGHIEASLTEEESKVLLFTSAVPREGKTTTAINLAASFVESGERILIIDGDLRRPSLSRRFEVTPVKDLSQVLRGEATPQEAIKETRASNLYLLGCQPGGEFPEGARLTNSLRKLLGWAKDHYDRVIIDMPVVMVVPGVTEFARAGGSILMVHRPGMVNVPVLEQVHHHMNLSAARLIGVILNGIRARSFTGSYYPLLPYYGVADRSVSKGDGSSSKRDV